jgi:uncharacterized protein (DUF1330 family)
MDDTRFYQLVLIWIHDPAMFGEYLRLLQPVVARYGGAADRSFAVTSIEADGLAPPQVVNLVHYDSRDAYQRFNEDPDFRAIEQLRSGSVSLMSFEGRLRSADPSPDGLADRRYRIEIASAAGISYHPEDRLEYVLDLEHSAGGPDLAVVSYRSAGAVLDPPSPVSAGRIRMAGHIHPAFRSR